MGRINQPQAAVLKVLRFGGMLTVSQIARDAELTTYRARHAISALRARGFVYTRNRGEARYEITARGRATIHAVGV